VKFSVCLRRGIGDKSSQRQNDLVFVLIVCVAEPGESPALLLSGWGRDASAAWVLSGSMAIENRNDVVK